MKMWKRCMRRDFSAYLHDILWAGSSIQAFVAGLTEETFAEADALNAAAERRFEIIGEALTQCRIHHKEQVDQLGSIQEIIDFRNYLAHRYDSVSSKIVWDIIQHDLPDLLSRVRLLLQAEID